MGNINIIELLKLFGFPTVAFTVLAYIFRQIYKNIKQNEEDNKAIKAGVQALLRNQMTNEFDKYSQKGYAPLWARTEFENLWKHYNTLGEDGVMVDLHNKFLELPVTPPEEPVRC